MNSQMTQKADDLLPEKIRVLHIDDEEDFLYLTKEFIERMSEGEIEVVSLRDTSSIIDKIKSEQIDVIVCDYLMEDLNGLDLLKTLKKEELNIPFIIFTGRGREEVVIDALNLGADYYLRKGSDAKSQYTELVHQIRTVLKHKKAEEALLKREQELKEERDLTQLYLNEATIMFVIVNADEEVELINKNVTQTLGFTKKDIVGKNWYDTVYPENIRDELKFSFQQVVVGMKDVIPYAEIEMLTKSGEKKIIAWRNTPIKDSSNKIIKILGLGEDITKRKEIEDAIKQSEEKYRGFVQNFAGIAFQGSIGFKPFFFHGAVEEITGFTEDDFVEGELTWDQVVLPEDMQVLMAINQQLESIPGFRSTIEYRIRHKNGEIKWIRQHIQNTTKGERDEFIVQGTLYDITEEKLAEQKLIESENLYRTIFESTGTANLLVSKEKIIKVVNTKFEELTGFSKDETENKLKWTRLLVEEDAKKLEKIQDIHFQESSSTPENFEIRFKIKEGVIKDALIYVKTIPGTTDFIVTVQDITQRKLDEQKLKESANLYKTLFEVTGTAIAISRKDTIVELINNQLVVTSGYSKEEIEGKMSWTNFVAESDIERLKELNRRRLEDPSSVPETYETKLKDKYGNIRTCLIHVGLIPETDKYIISIIDLTETKKAEQEYLKSADMYKTIFESTGTANIIMGPQRIIKEVNSKVVEMSGYQREELIGKNWSQFVPEEELGSLLKFSRSRTTEQRIDPPYIATKFINKNGRTRDVIVNLTSVPNSDDYVVAFFDITDMKEAEEKIKKSEILYRSVFETTGMANVIYDLNANIILVNSRMEKLSGYSREELEGKKWSDFIPHPELEMMQKYMHQRMVNPSSVPDQYETRFINKDGKSNSILIAVTKIPESNNYLATVADISERKKEVDILTKQKKELSDFAHLIAHDIRNCLSSIEGYIDLLQIEKSEQERYLQKINSQTEYMRKLLDRSIELADAGQTVEKSEIVDLDEIVKTIATMTIPPEIHFSSEHLFTVRADKEKLSQIFKNIFENAVKHGQPRIIEIKLQEKDNANVIKIINDGKIINKEIIKEAFESTYTTKEKESIHGLTIVKKLIDAHNWEIQLCRVSEKPCFNIIIPKTDIIQKKN